MNTVVMESLPFPGWQQFRADITAFGPRRLLSRLIHAAKQEVKHSGRFIGGAVHNYTNHPIICRAALRLILDDFDATEPDDTESLTDKRRDLFLRILLAANGLGNLAVWTPLDQGGERSRRRAIAELTYLLGFLHKDRNHTTVHEIARVWLYYRRYWDDVVRARPHQFSRNLKPLSTAFDCIEGYLFMAASVIPKQEVRLADPATTFALTRFGAQVDQVVKWYACDAHVAVGTWFDIERYPLGGIGSVFLKHPLLRLPDGSIIAPEPGMLLGGLDARLSQRLASTYDDASEREEVLTLLGHCHEAHLRALLSECATYSRDELFCDEFPFGNAELSPDGFLRGSEVTIFEAKATRTPDPPGRPKLSDFNTWLDTAAGARPPKRGPLDQGLRFLDAWRHNDSRVIAQLGRPPAVANINYVIVVPDPLPPIVNWMPYRRELWADQRFTAAQRGLNERTVFISIRELEYLVGTMRHLHKAGTPTTCASLLAAWHRSWPDDSKIAVVGNVSGAFKHNLTNFLSMHVPEARATTAKFIEKAFLEAMDEANRFGFAHQGDLPVGDVADPPT